jgi:hypothetical protein
MISRRLPFPYLLLALVALFAGLLSSAAAPAPLSFSGPHVAGQLGAPPKNEASGLAASRRLPDVLWTHDDSGGADSLFAVTTRGALLRSVKLAGARNDDWEDIASFTLDGTPWLLVGDIGDNDARRKHLTLYLLAEPTADQLRQTEKLSVRPAATFRLTFADGARDCESLAVDPRERALYLLSKRDLTPRLYRVALPTPLAPADLVAEFVTEVPELARPTGPDAFFAGLLEKGRARPCGMDFAPDGSAAAVVTYADVVVFPRGPGESWATAFARKPLRLRPHDLPQAEAICFSADGRSLFVASESTRTLLRYDRN